MNELYARKTVVDVGVRPYVCNEWDVFEFRMYNFADYVSKNLAEDHPRVSVYDTSLYKSDQLRVDMHTFNGFLFISAGHVRAASDIDMILKVRDVDEMVLFEERFQPRWLNRLREIQLQMELSHVMEKSSKVLKDGHFIFELWMKLVSGWNDYTHLFRPKNPLCQNVLNLYSDETDSDVFFEVKDDTESLQIIPAHRLILKASAPTLAALCRGYDKATPVPITGVKRGVFNLVLYYAYGGTISTSNLEKHSKELMEAADRFELPTLKVEAEGFYVKSLIITVDNFIEIYQYADAKNYPLVKEACIVFFLHKKNGLNIIQSPTYIEAAKISTIGTDLLFHTLSSAKTRAPRKGLEY